jgi:molybdopterin converting factor small subunit
VSVQVLWFASLADRTRTRCETVPADDLPDVDALWAALERRHPSLREVRPRPVPTCDGRRVSWTASLHGVREVVFLPPVSGG